jgi:hemerythrin-like metal-binding protein
MKVDHQGEQLSVGHEAIDLEHRVQVGLVDAIAEAVEQSRGQTFISGLVEKLYDFTNTHFLSEQLLMRLHSFPGYEAHVREHDRLIDQLGKLRRGIETGETAPTLEILSTLRRWLLGHIRTDDVVLGEYLARAGKEDDQTAG